MGALQGRAQPLILVRAASLPLRGALLGVPLAFVTLFLVAPLTLTVVISFQKMIYNPAPPTAKQLADPNYIPVLPDHPMSWYLTHLSIALAVSLAMLFGALALFSRLEDNFAEEI